ncbi:MAG: nucleotidyltransferase domain-containing protein [bacterium]
MIEQETLNQATQRMVDMFHPAKIILIGSQARGTADSRSDVDILVICPIEGSRRKLMVAIDRALAGLGFARDIIVLTPQEFERDRHIPGTIARPAWQEGRILYEQPHQ